MSSKTWRDFWQWRLIRCTVHNEGIISPASQDEEVSNMRGHDWNSGNIACPTCQQFIRKVLMYSCSMNSLKLWHLTDHQSVHYHANFAILILSAADVSNRSFSFDFLESLVCRPRHLIITTRGGERLQQGYDDIVVLEWLPVKVGKPHKLLGLFAGQRWRQLWLQRDLCVCCQERQQTLERTGWEFKAYTFCLTHEADSSGTQK